jgi:hypothetical protein
MVKLTQRPAPGYDLFAHEFGSGVYDFNGRTLQVYGLPFGWTAVEPGQDQAGLRLRLPVTLGFLDFHAADVIETGLPDKVDSVSFVPGVELAFVVAERWRLLPYVQAGLSTASEPDVETDLFGAGIRAERVFAAGEFEGLYAGAAALACRPSRRLRPDDDFLRLRNSLDSSATPASRWATTRSRSGCSATIDVSRSADGPTTGIDVPRTQLETGIVFGARPNGRSGKYCCRASGSAIGSPAMSRRCASSSGRF